MPESRGMMRNPEGKRGTSSVKEASIGANMSSAHVPIAFSSIPLHSYQIPEHQKKQMEAGR